MSGEMIYITLGEVSERISALFKNITLQVIDFLTPILTIAGLVQIVFGIVAISLGREWIGYRLLVGGGILLIVTYFVIPMLLSFL